MHSGSQYQKWVEVAHVDQLPSLWPNFWTPFLPDMSRYWQSADCLSVCIAKQFWCMTVVPWLQQILLLCQVENEPSAVLLSEITQFVKPGTHIISVVLVSCMRQDKLGYACNFMIPKKEFVMSQDCSVHTQNIEIRNQWTKNAINRYGQLLLCGVHV